MDDINLIHGGDAQGFAARYGKPPLDFSANTNPFGVPQGVADAICAAAKAADRYPDPLCRALRLAIAQSEGVVGDHIFCGNGAADVIYRLAAVIKPRCALVLAPTFAEYALALTALGCAVRQHTLSADNGFALTDIFLDELKAPVEAVFLCNPNNPTGRTIDPALMKSILRRCAEQNIDVVVDECFLGFTENPEVHSLCGLLAQYPKLVVLRAFTKLYAMAGVRLGYCLCADKSLPQRLYRAGPPWAVSSLAQAAGIAALQEWAYLKESLALIRTERRRMTQALQDLGLQVVASEANFIMFFSPVAELGERLSQRGILLRDCANFMGLCVGYYRCAVRTIAENDRLLAALGEIMEARG